MTSDFTAPTSYPAGSFSAAELDAFRFVPIVTPWAAKTYRLKPVFRMTTLLARNIIRFTRGPS